MAADQPARILFPYAGGEVGGSHFSSLLLATNLDPTRYQPVILVHRPGGALEAHLTANGIPWQLAERRIAPVHGLAAFRSLAARMDFLREQGIAILHTNEGAMHALWSPAARLLGIPVVWHHRSQPEARGLRLLAPITATRVVSVSQYAAPRPGPYSAARRAVVVYSPFEAGEALESAQRHRAACRAEVGASDETLVLGHFAHVVERKRPLLFIDAVLEAGRRMDRPVLGLMFGSNLDPALDAEAERRISMPAAAGRIRRMGFRRPIEPWIAACDANVVTAVDEPFGRSLIEAMMIGTPVIATRSGGNAEAIADGETGLLVPPEDPSALAGAIVALADRECARAIAARARESATMRFGVQTHVQSISAIYEQLLRA